MTRYLRLAELAVVLFFVLSACGGLSEAEQRHSAGVEHQLEGRLDEAVAEYDEAIRLDPRYAKAYGNRGVVYTALGQHQRAIQDFDEAIRLDPQLGPSPTATGEAPTTI